LRSAAGLDPEFQELWNRVTPKTVFSVEYSTGERVKQVDRGIQEMEPIKPTRIRCAENQGEVERAGLSGTTIREGDVTVS